MAPAIHPHLPVPLYVTAEGHIAHFTKDFDSTTAEKVQRLAQDWIHALRYKFSNNSPAYAEFQKALRSEERRDQAKLFGFAALFTSYACGKLECLECGQDFATFRALQDKSQLESFFFANEILFEADDEGYRLTIGALEKLAELIVKEEKELSSVNEYFSMLFPKAGLEAPLFQSLGLREYAFGLSASYQGDYDAHQGLALLSAAEGFRFKLPEAPLDNVREFNNWGLDQFRAVTQTPFFFKGSIVNLRLAIDKIHQIERDGTLLRDELLLPIIQGAQGQISGVQLTVGPCAKDMRALCEKVLTGEKKLEEVDMLEVHSSARVQILKECQIPAQSSSTNHVQVPLLGSPAVSAYIIFSTDMEADIVKQNLSVLTEKMIGEETEWVSLEAMGIRGICGNFSPQNLAALTKKTALHRQAQGITYVRADQGPTRNSDHRRVHLWKLYLEERAFEVFGVQPNPYRLVADAFKEKLAGLPEEQREALSPKDMEALVRIYVRSYLSQFGDKAQDTISLDMEGAGLLEKLKGSDIAELFQLAFSTLNTPEVKSAFSETAPVGALRKTLKMINTLEDLETAYAEFFVDHLNSYFVPSLGLFRITDIPLKVIYQTLKIPPEKSFLLEAMQTNDAVVLGKSLNEPFLTPSQREAASSFLSAAIQNFESSPLFSQNREALGPSMEALKEPLLAKLTNKFATVTVLEHMKGASYYQWEHYIQALNYLSQIGIRLHELHPEALGPFKLDFGHAEWTGCDLGLATKLRSLYALLCSSPFSERVFCWQELSAKYLSGKEMGGKLRDAIEKELATPHKKRIDEAKRLIAAFKADIKRISGSRLEADIGSWSANTIRIHLAVPYGGVFNLPEEIEVRLRVVACEERVIERAERTIASFSKERAWFLGTIQTVLHEIIGVGLQACSRILDSERAHPFPLVRDAIRKVLPVFLAKFYKNNPDAALKTYYSACSYYKEMLSAALQSGKGFKEFFDLTKMDPHKYLTIDGFSYDHTAILKDLPEAVFKLLVETGILVNRLDQQKIVGLEELIEPLSRIYQGPFMRLPKQEGHLTSSDLLLGAGETLLRGLGLEEDERKEQEVL